MGHLYLNSPSKKVAHSLHCFTPIFDMKFHSIIILAFILLNLFHKINGRSIQCPPEWIPNGEYGLNKLCDANNNGVHIPHPTDCKKFVQCDKCYAVVKICPAGTSFDENLGICNHDLNCSKISNEEVSNEEVSNEEVSNKEVSIEEVSDEEVSTEVTTNNLEIRRFQ